MIFLPPGTPPASSRTWRSVAPKATSYTPGRATWPETQKSFGPADSFVPMAANAGPPSRTMSSTFTRVSTLFTTVGFLKRPTWVGKGGFDRGSPRKPSMELKRAVSSPQMYAPAPFRTSIRKSNASPMMFAPRKPRFSALFDRVLKPPDGERIFAAHVDVPLVRSPWRIRRRWWPRSRRRDPPP